MLMAHCRPMHDRLNRSVATTVNCPRDWTAVVTRNMPAAAHMALLMTSYRPLLSRRRHRPLLSPARFCQRSRTGRTKCCRRLRNGTTTWRWTYRLRLWFHPSLYHQEVLLFLPPPNVEMCGNCFLHSHSHGPISIPMQSVTIYSHS